MENISREEAEKTLLKMAEAMVKYYHAYFPDGSYLSFCYIRRGEGDFDDEDYINIHNENFRKSSTGKVIDLHKFYEGEDGI